MTANADRRSRTSWYDPAAGARRIVLPVREQRVWATVRTAARADLPIGAKLRCLATVPTTHYARRLRVHGGRAKRRLRATPSLGRTARPAS